MIRLVCKSEQDRRKKIGRCVAARCACKSRAKSKWLCHTHYNQYRKDQDPASYYYYHLLMNAKARKIPFSLTLPEFREFCERTGYLAVKGRNKNAGQIDRIRSTEGYHASNIQLLDQAMNGRKRFIDKMLREKAESKLTEAEKQQIQDFYKELESSPSYVQDIKLDLPF